MSAAQNGNFSIWSAARHMVHVQVRVRIRANTVCIIIVRRGSFEMGVIKMLGCLVFVLFSGYLLLQAERGRRYLVDSPPSNPALSDTPREESTSESAWIDVGVNSLLLVSTFLCYDLIVTNILVFSLATDRFFLRTPLRLLLGAMVGVLAGAAWYEVPSLREELQLLWTSTRS